MLSDAQRDAGFNVALQAGARVGFTIWHPVVLQAAVANWYFPADGGAGGAVMVGGGLRFEPFIGTVGRLFVDGDVGAGFTGSVSRTMIDIGLGFEFAATRWLGVGPVLRYGRLIAQAADVPADPQFWSIGVTLAPRFPPAPPPPPPAIAPPDADHDGVLDPVDQCPEVIAGEHPNPDRLGCPDGDEDHDTILDHGDACRAEAAGAHPDPARPGCPLPDRDGDAVPDPSDACPDAAPGEHPDPDRAGCPDGDQDHDGVLDHGDQCRAEPAGAHPDPARAGCPLPDADGDGIPDASDHCPSQAGAPNTDPNRNGCPGLVIIQRNEIRITQQVFFATNTDRILPRSFPLLQAVADAMRAMPEIRRVAVEGHTDDTGNAEANMALSQRRAVAVMQWLTAHGVDAGRLEAHGYGSTQPLQQGRSAAARAANRRVQFRIVGASSSGPPAQQ
jgi:outer membrane protein OmpA-like peptidoglycan-associated protein